MSDELTDTWIANLFNTEEAAALTGELITFRSYPGEEGPVLRHIAEWFLAIGMTRVGHPIPALPTARATVSTVSAPPT
jgi:hypothetical protein